MRAGTLEKELKFNEAVARALAYWTAVSKMIPLWGKVQAGQMKSVDLRQEYICAHSVVRRALGSVGADLFRLHPNGWKERLIELNTVDWRKVNLNWENVCIVANSVVSNRQARLATKAYLKRKARLELTDPENRALTAVPELGDRQQSDPVPEFKALADGEGKAVWYRNDRVDAPPGSPNAKVLAALNKDRAMDLEELQEAAGLSIQPRRVFLDYLVKTGRAVLEGTGVSKDRYRW